MNFRNTTDYAALPLFTFFEGGTLSIVVKGAFSIVTDGVAQFIEGGSMIGGDVPEPPAEVSEPESGMSDISAVPEPTAELDLPDVAPLRPIDEYFDPGSLPLLKAADLVPLKASPELLFCGVCHPPAPATQACRVSISLGKWSKALAVFGDRVWQKKMLGLVPVRTDPVPFDAMPITWSRAFGGKGSDANPAGIGLEQVDLAAGGSATPLPNIEHPDTPIGGPSDTPAPAGFGPIAPLWEPRRSLMGEAKRFRYPEDWPWFPPGYNAAYFNASPADQRLDAVVGDEELVLEHLVAGQPLVKTRLPGRRVRAWVKRTAGGGPAEVEMVLDTIAIDGESGTVSLTWRGRLSCADEDFSDVEEIVVAEQAITGPAVPAEVIAPPAPVEPPPLPEAPAVPDAELTDPGDVLPPEFEEGMKEVEEQIGPLPPLEPPDEAALAKVGITPEMFERSGGAPSPALIDREVKSLVDAGVPEAEARSVIEQVIEAASTEPPVEPVPPETPGAKLEAGQAMPEAQLAGADLSGAVAPEAELPNADLKGADLSGASLPGADLIGADLTGASLAGADLTGADLTGAKLAQADLSGTVFDGATLKDADLSGATAPGATFVEADASGAIFDDADLTSAILSGANLASSSFQRAALAGASLLSVAAAGAKFNEAVIDKLSAGQQSVFDDAVFAGTAGQAPSFDGSSMIGADLSGVRWNAAYLERANLDRVTATGASFREAFFKRATVRDADLSRCDFFRAFLWCADISRSNVAGASLHGAEVFGLVRDGAYGDGVDFSNTKLELAT
ncbi:MAG: DUF2169 domain-containing protein [Planctomycetota bacterium]